MRLLAEKLNKRGKLVLKVKCSFIERVTIMYGLFQIQLVTYQVVDNM